MRLSKTLSSAEPQGFHVAGFPLLCFKNACSYQHYPCQKSVTFAFWQVFQVDGNNSINFRMWITDNIHYFWIHTPLWTSPVLAKE